MRKYWARVNRLHPLDITPTFFSTYPGNRFRSKRRERRRNRQKLVPEDKDTTVRTESISCISQVPLIRKEGRGPHPCRNMQRRVKLIGTKGYIGQVIRKGEIMPPSLTWVFGTMQEGQKSSFRSRRTKQLETGMDHLSPSERNSVISSLQKSKNRLQKNTIPEGKFDEEYADISLSTM